MSFEFEWNPSWIMNNESRQDICWLLTVDWSWSTWQSWPSWHDQSASLCSLLSSCQHRPDISTHNWRFVLCWVWNSTFNLFCSTFACDHLLTSLLTPPVVRETSLTSLNKLHPTPSEPVSPVSPGRNKKEIFYSIFSIIFPKWTNGKEL